jgi:peptidoglycan hydrolase-like protein with peptidoglycan-binding domain
MTFSGRSTQIAESAQRSSRAGTTIDSFIAHGAAGTSLIGVVAMMQSGSRQVSSNYIIGVNGEIVGVVDEEDRAWTSGSSSDGGRGAAWDRRAMTFEAINSGGAAAGWPFSHATMEAAAQLLADVSARHGFDIADQNTPGHRELWTLYRASYATACPQSFDLGWWRARAREIRGLGGPVPPINPGTHIPGTAAATYNGYAVTAIQTLLGKAGFATAVDGIYGPDTKANVTAFQRSAGITADGIVGAVTWSRLNGVTTPPSGKLVVDGIWGANTTRALQRALGVVADGVIGPVTRKVLQRHVGATADGVWGTGTKKALQRHLRVTADGNWGGITIRALQTRLNEGTF